MERGSVVCFHENMTRIRRIAFAAAALWAASTAYQRVAEARDRRRFPPPGRLVGVGPRGRKLHLVTAGDGEPTVVIIPALADNVLLWMRVLEGVAAETRACVYDRAEVGWSDPPPRWRRTPDLMAADLHALLAAAGVPPPYIVVGHSVGGIVARRFYAQRPDLVAGMVLVESSHEEQPRRFGAQDWRRGPIFHIKVAARRQARILGARRFAERLGLLRDFDADIAREVLPEHADAYRAIMLSTRFRRAVVAEVLMMTHTWGSPPELGSTPLTVLTAARQPSSVKSAWMEMQDELAALSSDSRHVTVADAGHYMHLDLPDVVVTEIRKLVARCRPEGGRGAT